MEADIEVAGQSALARPMDRYSVDLPGESADGIDVLDGADLAVGRFHRYQARVRAHRVADGVHADEAFAVRIENGQLDAALGQPSGGSENRLVLQRGGDEVVAGLELMECDVVRLRRSRGEVDFVRLHSEETGDADARLFQRIRRAAAMLVSQRRRVPEILRKVRQ